MHALTRTMIAAHAWVAGTPAAMTAVILQGTPRSWRRGLIAALLGVCAACGGLLDVSDPTVVQDKDVANADGANSRRLDVFTNFYQATIASAKDVALITDERIVDLPLTQNRVEYYLDRRDSQGYESLYSTTQSSDPHLGTLDAIVAKSSVAIPQVRAYTPDSLRGDFLSQLFGFRGYAILQIAEDICPGFPINDIDNNLPVLSGPYTTDSATAYAITALDSAIADAKDSTQFLYFAQVLKGRALLDLGQYTQAAAAVSTVPTNFVAQTVMYANYNSLFVQASTWTGSSNVRLAVGDTEGTNGLPFVAAHDQRLLTVYKARRYNNVLDSLYDQLKYTSTAVPVTLVSGIEARLIEAEAALNAGDPSWFTTLNTLRATISMPAIQTMPTTTKAQVDLLYRERAFWLYLTGRRLGDMRRLIRNYGRDPETVFPTGPYSSRGGNYGTATAIPFVQAVEQRANPRILSGCTIR